jgi:hypothetical protein
MVISMALCPTISITTRGCTPRESRRLTQVCRRWRRTRLGWACKANGHLDGEEANPRSVTHSIADGRPARAAGRGRVSEEPLPRGSAGACRGHMIWTLSACGPFWPWLVSKDTRWPSSSDL